MVMHARTAGGDLKDRLKSLWQWWERFARKLGEFQARLILSLLYILIVLPMGLALRLFSDPLRLKKTAAHWQSKPGSPPCIEEARRQF